MRADEPDQGLGQVRHTASPAPPEAIPRRLSESSWTSAIDHLTARDLMTPGVVTIADDASLGNGMRALAAHGIHAILIVGGRSGEPLGWATDRGLLAHLERDAPLTPIREAITEEVVSVTPGTTAREAAVALARAGTSHLLVVAGSERAAEGVISALDLVRAAGG